MSEDTERALAAIRPLAEALNIEVRADDTFLYLNGQAIGIECNSTYATVLEFVGYVFLDVWPRDKWVRIPQELKERIRRYWLSPDQLKFFLRAKGGEYRG